MAWYERNGPGKDVFVSTRIRLARNLSDYPFDGRLSADAAREIVSKVTAVFPEKDGYLITDMNALSTAEAISMAEKHYVSREFADKRTPHALIREEVKGLSVMVCEEDHLRIQAMAAGFSPDECLNTVYEAEEKLDRALGFAFDEKLGYLTHCPTNLGTGMRVSVMMFLPALARSGKMNALSAQLQKMGIIVRGTNGEGSDARGYLYQISNQVTMGLTEEETVQKVTVLVKKLAEEERKLRASFDEGTKWKLADRACRAYGILTNAKMLSTDEFFSLWADLRLGMTMKVTENIQAETLDQMVFLLMPASMTMKGNERTDLSPAMKRDIARAECAKNILTGVNA